MDNSAEERPPYGLLTLRLCFIEAVEATGCSKEFVKTSAV